MGPLLSQLLQRFTNLRAINPEEWPMLLSCDDTTLAALLVRSSTFMQHCSLVKCSKHRSCRAAAAALCGALQDGMSGLDASRKAVF
jgi:hypothetical protein